ncbi:hypothetical protein CP04DC42_0267A, partial [Chlamydia psittaci 04DC42]|jgi:hypothetical protein
MRGGG